MGKFRDIQEFVRLSRDCRDLDALRNLIEDTARTFGFRYFLISHHINVLGPNVVQLSNYPEDWSNTMRKKSQFAADPVVRACQKTAVPFLWSELGRIIPLSTAQKDILKGASSAGFGEGFSVPIHIPGECTGSGSFAVASGKALDEATVPSVNYVASFAFEAARRLLLRTNKLNFDVDSVPGLTERQLDCIVLMAQGKSDWDAGRILGISQRTVQEHLDIARRRYGVGSRAQLIVRALFDNQIGFQEIIHT